MEVSALYPERKVLEVLLDTPPEEHDYYHLTRPQVATLKDPLTGILVTDALIRFETLQQDFDLICDRIGKPRVLLPHVNAKVSTGDYRALYTPQTKALVEAMFAEDLETFHYSF